MRFVAQPQQIGFDICDPTEGFVNMRRHLLRAISRILPSKLRGQGTIEFALVAFVLFFLILGIIEVGRLLYVFSAVSNAAQEGSRYAMVRPRDFFNLAEAQRRISQGTAVPTHVVVANGACNVVDKTREKVVGIPPADVRVHITFDNGNGTPTPVPSDYDDFQVVVAPSGIN